MKVVLVNAHGESLFVDVEAQSPADAAQALAPFIGRQVNVAAADQELQALQITVREELSMANEALGLAKVRYTLAQELLNRLEDEGGAGVPAVVGE